MLDEVEEGGVVSLMSGNEDFGVYKFEWNRLHTHK